MSLNTRKQRNHLYGFTFLKWKVEQRLSTLQKSAIETSLSVHNFGNGASEAHFLKMCETLSDLETMIEVAEETFPTLRHEMDRIKKEKLTALKKREKLNGEAKELEEKAEQKKEAASKVPEEQKKKKGILKHLFN